MIQYFIRFVVTVIKFFVHLLLFLPLLVNAQVYRWTDIKGNTHYSDEPHQQAEKIQLNAGTSSYQVKRVYDGDTLLLTNRQKIRLLGINTPEVESRGKLEEVGGEVAKQWLKNALEIETIHLEMDVEKKDKYGRLLAHVFTSKNVHINVELLRLGLAVLSIYPPNLNYLEAFIAAQNSAETAKRGIWGNPAYAIKSVDELNRSNYKGWQRLTGAVKKIKTGRKYISLRLSKNFEIKIQKSSLALFPELKTYQDKTLEVRGWPSRRGKRYSLFVRHPSAIKIIN